MIASVILTFYQYSISIQKYKARLFLSRVKTTTTVLLPTAFNTIEIPPGGRVGNMLAWHAVKLGSILGRGDT